MVVLPLGGLIPPPIHFLGGLYRLPTNYLVLARIAYINLIPFDIPLYILWARPSPKSEFDHPIPPCRPPPITTDQANI